MDFASIDGRREIRLERIIHSPGKSMGTARHTNPTRERGRRFVGPSLARRAGGCLAARRIGVCPRLRVGLVLGYESSGLRLHRAAQGRGPGGFVLL